MFDGILEQFGLKQYDYLDYISEGSSKGLSEAEFYQLELDAWLKSPKRKQMLKAMKYYNYEQKLPPKQRIWGTDSDGMPVYVTDEEEGLVDNQYANLVDQKVNYFLSKPFTIRTDNDTYTDWLQQILDDEFRNVLIDAAAYCLNNGLVWIHPYFDGEGKLQFRYFPAYEILPFWSDDAHTKLDKALRYYVSFTYEGKTLRVVRHVDIYSADGIQQYVYDGSALTQEAGTEARSYGISGDNTVFRWGKIPLIAFKYNSQEMPLLNRVESLQNAYNRNITGWNTNMTENVRDCIMVLKNYGGTDLNEFKDNLTKFGAVKVRDDGGLELLRVERDADSYKEYRSALKKAIVENGRGFDSKDDRVNTNPNEMNLKSMFADIDLDTSMIERQYHAAFKSLLWFINKYLQMSGAGDFSGEHVVINFDRNIIVNETDTVNNIKTSQGIVSNETLLAHHPYVFDVKKEMARVKREQEEQLQQMVDYGSLEEAEKLGSGDGGGSG